MEIWNRQWQSLKTEKFEVGMGDQKIHALTKKIFLSCFFLCSGAAVADDKIVERDTDKDGKMDQIGHFDAAGNKISNSLRVKSLEDFTREILT